MKTIMLAVVMFSFSVTAHTMDLEYLRKNYSKAVSDKELCQSLIVQLSKKTESEVHFAYLGALHTIWANHVFSPLSKLNSFLQGKTEIELAVKKDPNNVEIRFIRLSVQKNCPSFLGYNSNIASDKKYLKDHLSSITSEQLKKMVKELID